MAQICRGAPRATRARTHAHTHARAHQTATNSRALQHRYNLRRRAAGLAPIDSAVFERVRATAAAQAQLDSASDKKRDHLKNKDEAAPPSVPPAPVDVVVDDDVDAVEQVAKAVADFAPNPRRCVFCKAEEFADTNANLEHMLAAHGFHLPDMAAVTDVEGLVNYCAEKVHVGRICLFCDKGFASTDACAEHMVAKAHCRLAWEYEDQVDEFADFYDFARLDAEDKGTMHVDSVTGELVLTDADGSVSRYGPSKDFNSVYRSAKEQARPKNPALQAQANERALQLYRNHGVAVSSALTVSTEVRHRLVRAKRERRNIEQRRMGWQLHNSLQQNWLQKHAVAGTNVGAGHGVHG